MKSRKWCFVPGCVNTSNNSPQRVFISVPQTLSKKRKWFAAARRDLNDVSLKTVFFCCEDHFNLQEDMENYYEYTLSKVHARMKPDVVPHIFTCPPDKTDVVIPRLSSEKREDVLPEKVYFPRDFTSTLTTTTSPSRPASRISEMPITNHAKKPKMDDKNKEAILHKIITKLDEKEDEFDVAGKHIGNKLRHLSRDQRIHAEKIIMDVLYEAQLGTLNRGSKLQVNQERIE